MDIPGVLYRFADRTITPQEAADFAAYLQTLSPEQFSALMARYGRIVAASAFEGEPDEALLSLIQGRLDRIDEWAQPVRPAVYGEGSLVPGDRAGAPVRRLRRYGAVAAAACLLLIAGTYMYTHRLQPAPPPVAQAPQIAPGGDKAVLTLGNGKQIVLDTAVNGTLALVGAARVVKAAGQVDYRVEGNAGGKVSYNTMTTPRGGVYRLTLPDGSKVWLNALSSIRFPNVFTGKERSVEVTGEAYLDVVKDPSKPFVVSSGGMRVQVLGTAFDLMAYTDEGDIRATLVNGAVKVLSGGAARVIAPGEQAVIRAGGLPGARSAPVVMAADLNEVLAWKEGSFRFYNAKINTIMRQIARWYDVEVVYEGTPPPDDFYCVIARKQYASQLLDILEQTNNVHFRIDGRRITVMAGPR